jgi:PAS domain S-box-containing protein
MDRGVDTLALRSAGNPAETPATQSTVAIGEGLLRRIVETATDAIVVIGDDQRIVLFNAAAEAMFNRSRQGAVGELITELVPKRFRATHPDHVHEFGANPQPPRMMSPKRLIVGLRSDGEEFPLEASISTSEEDGRKFHTAILRDVTERERTRAALLQSNLDLQQFAFAASHDMRSPLRSIAGFLRLLESRHGGALEPAPRELIQRCIAAVSQLDRLTEDLLCFARIEATTDADADVDCNAALADSLRLLEHSVSQAQAQIHAGVLPVVTVNRLHLVRLFQNLLDNSIKYCRDRRPEIRIEATRRDAGWIFSLADNGIGIDKRYHQRIFETFKRLHTQQEYPGTGIGLAVCRRIVEHLGGVIWVESDPGRGSTFHFTVPDRSPR